MKHLLPFFKKYRWQSILAPLFKMLEATFDLIVPLVVADIINVGIKTGSSSYIFSRFGILLALALLGLLSSFTAQYFAAKAAIGTASELRHRLLQHIQGLNFACLDKIGTSTLITRMTSDINQVQNGLNMFLRLFLRSPFIVFGAMIMAFSINFDIALIFAVAIPVLFVIVFGIMLITNPLYKKQQKNLDALTTSTKENLAGVRVVRAFAREEAELNEFEAVNHKLRQISLKVGKISALLNPLTYVIINLGIILILWFGAKMVDGGTLLSGDVIALVNYLSQILIELVKLANLVVVIGKAIVSMGRVGKILDTRPTMSYGNADTEEKCDYILTMNNAALTYPDSPDTALCDINLNIRRGETVGIIGSTGSGKTSLVNLIARFYDATEGQVLLGGRDIKDWSREAIRKKVAVVMQKPQMLSGTVRSNLSVGKKDATDEELWAALDMAQGSEFVRKKDGGLDAVVEQGGRNLSGGQKQRLSIARALVAKPDILILDDSSSALDYATDAALRKAIKGLPDETTVIIVSQRAGTIMHSDKIVVMDDGKISAVGTHTELMESSDIYKEIYESTTKKERE